MITNDELRVILTEFLVWLHMTPHPEEKVSEIVNEFVSYRNMK